MATKLERIEDDLKEAAERAIDEALAPALTRLERRIDELGEMADLLTRVAKIEHWLANLGDLAKLSERVATMDKTITSHDLDIAGNSANIKALVDEMKLGGQINASLQGQISGLRTEFLHFVDEVRNIPLDHVAAPDDAPDDALLALEPREHW